MAVTSSKNIKINQQYTNKKQPNFIRENKNRYLISILSNLKQGGLICLAGDDPQNQDYKLKMINMKLNLLVLGFLLATIFV